MKVFVWTINISYASAEDVSGRETSWKHLRISCIKTYNKHKLVLEHCRNIEQAHIRDIQDVPGGKVNILGGHISVILSKKLYTNMCSISNDFRDTAI
jgi:hypothetical protein